MSKIHVLHAKVEHVREGKIIWQDLIENVLHRQGETALLSAYFATAMSDYGPPPANLYLGLDARATLADTNTLSSISGEPTGAGYARKALSTAGTGASGQDFYITLPGTYYQAQGKVVNFSNSDTVAWSQVLNMFLSTASSGTSGLLIASLALTAARTLQVGDQLNASIYVGLSN